MSSSDRSDDQAVQPKTPGLSDVVGENIAEIVKMRAEQERRKNSEERLADLLTLFSGSMMFVYVHAVWFGLWILFNVGWLGGTPFDPFPFSLLTLIVSLEAIFLSTFVLISQNHAGAIADKRADLDLQINLLAEHEVTHLLALVDAIADHLGVHRDNELEDLKKNVGARQVVDELESRERIENSHK
ncbi:MAG TPA: DUF1003 domain-containing protein [Blastocatellia bacterium]|nr:DUF1003 domain-containing protein [Blastocatellia bacterium]